MLQLISILSALQQFIAFTTSSEEHWLYLKMEGDVNASLWNAYKKLVELLDDIKAANFVTLRVNGSKVESEDIDAYTGMPDNNHPLKWELNFNKLPLFSIMQDDGWHYNFFLSSEKCQAWIRGLNPVLRSCPINGDKPIRILIGDLKKSFGGKKIQFLSTLEISFVPSLRNHQLPDPERLKETVHFYTSEDISINLNAWNIAFSKSNIAIEQTFLYQSCIAFSIYLLAAFYSVDKVIVSGARKVTLPLFNRKEKLDEEFYYQLLIGVSWVYEERSLIRKALFNERISLDYIEGETLLKTLQKGLSQVVEQAKERYNFAIIDRKDAYVKELRDLLKDIRIQSELYSGKIRTLLSNFLRDVLAALVLIGFTIFTKFTDQDTLANNHRLRLVFYALAIYFILSIIFQSIIDWTDMIVSKGEMLYWKNATKELLPEKDFKNHIDKSLKARRISVEVIYPLIGLFYILIAYVCYDFPRIYEHWFK